MQSKKHKYLVFCISPLALITAAILLGILSINFWQSPFVSCITLLYQLLHIFCSPFFQDILCISSALMYSLSICTFPHYSILHFSHFFLVVKSINCYYLLSVSRHPIWYLIILDPWLSFDLIPILICLSLWIFTSRSRYQ